MHIPPSQISIRIAFLTLHTVKKTQDIHAME